MNVQDFQQEASAQRRALVVDDEADIRDLLCLTLGRMGLLVDAVGLVAAAKESLRQNRYDLCLADMRLPDGEGLELVSHVAANYPGMPVAVITAFGSAENAVAALKAGAFDYLSKPVSLKVLRALVKSALKLSASAPAGRTAAGQCGLLGDSAPMQQVRMMIGKLARSQAPVHITGESGSGKELAARSIHQGGSRSDAPFVAVNCGAIPENLMESEFFGHKKGAFTDAVQDKDGFFQVASGGTLFLDEVADMPLPMQVKLLRAIQEKRVRKIGATQEEVVDVRLISATHRDLAQCVENGEFRQDLYYRINVISLRMPSLQEISEDISLLAETMLNRMADTHGAPSKLSPDALKCLREYRFSGNVRELENILERAVALTGGGVIRREDLHLASRPPARQLKDLPLPELLDSVEKEAILDALEKTRYNKTAAARLLGISFRALRHRLERLGIH